MSDRIQHLLDQIATLEDDLRAALREQESNPLFHFKNKRIEFEQAIKQRHRQLKTGFFHWLTTNRPQNLLTGPIIYSMIVPLLILDLFVSIYQATCFPIYRIAKVRRADYIVLDRHHLQYLNWIEKFHCSYCAYGSGLLAYVNAIVAKTEQYFCPIKHAHKMLGTHSRYAAFLAYGDAGDYAAKLEKFRKALEGEK